MKTPRMANSVGHIDDDLVSAAAECKKIKKNNWTKWGSLAAGFAVLVVAVTIILPTLLEDNELPTVPNNGKYKNYSWT